MATDRLSISTYQQRSSPRQNEIQGRRSSESWKVTPQFQERFIEMAFLLCGADGADKENMKPTVRAKEFANNPHLRLVPEINVDLINMDTVTVVIKRGKRGYGFSVTGSSPATVRRVEDGSAADQAGLHVGDAVIRINGQNVSRSIADSVAKIVRQSEKQIILDLQRDGVTNKPGNDDTVCKLLQRKPLATINEDENFEKVNQESILSSKNDLERQSLLSSEDSAMDVSHDLTHDHLIVIGEWDWQRSPKMALPSFSIFSRDLTEKERERQAAIQKLVRCEQQFVGLMQFGIQRYSNPLRHKFVSPAEHGTLFQNVEKLVSISEYHVYKLKEDSIGYADVKDPDEMFIDIVGCTYLPKLLMMSEIFEQYCNGIKNSFRLLAELKSYEEFNQFLRDPALESGQLTISGFIQKPLEHIKNLVLNLQEILSLTSLEHQDMDNLSQVIETLRNACNRINESNTRRSCSMTSLVSRSSRRSSPRSISSRSSEQSAAYTILSDSSGSSIESSVDTEVLDIQRRLVFCEHVQAFQLATATRHMIYSGELMHVDGLLCTKLFVVLMSDLLLLTRVEQDNSLLVVDYPILLHDIVEPDWTDTTTMDFTLGVESLTNATWVEPRDITLRAPSIEHKFTWKNLIEQRISSSRLQQETMNPDNIV
ncbi:hypothetical protein LSH36_22g00005 [Paralvinella palmiformis]|uniref:Uncharacterized protein n=1 Tax=Paralvinella palmiformis TaxID=53620 RepID=A0AAD9KB76_9ANNE|nr:hypothetical protein LSH36_22g00005 [Paralvinella palmiformis]